MTGSGVFPGANHSDRQTGFKALSLAMSRGRAIVIQPNKKGKRNTLRREASLKDVCTTVCPPPTMSMKVKAHPFSGQSAKNFTYVFLFSISILHSGLISIL